MGKQRSETMEDQNDILTEATIREYLTADCSGMQIHVLPAVDSTNTLLKEMAGEGAPEGSAVIAGAQTKGKGRLGRRFYSPPGTGVYLSLLLRPEQLSLDQAVKVTAVAAVAGCEAIEAAAGRKAEIKWVNDIYMDGKKVCGILAEASMGSQNAGLSYIVLGIGFNVFPPKEGFPDELRKAAGSIFPEKAEKARARLAAGFLNRFFSYYVNTEKDHVQKYRDRSFVTGKDVYVLTPGEKKQARALDIDEDCRLVVRYEDGSVEHLSSGEISIRPVTDWS